MHTPILAERDGRTYYVTKSTNHNVFRTLLSVQDDLPHVARIAHLEGDLVLTEFIEAPTLWELQESSRPPLARVEAMLEGLLTALSVIPLIHGDLRPWNILYRAEDRAFFTLDWGYGFLPSRDLPSGKIRAHLEARGHRAPFTDVDREDASRIIEVLRSPTRTAGLWRMNQRITWHPPAWR